jgi:hypothetical protein
LVGIALKANASAAGHRVSAVVVVSPIVVPAASTFKASGTPVPWQCR